MLRLLTTVCLIFSFATFSFSATKLEDEGINKGYINELNFIGAEVSASRSGITGNITISAGAGDVAGPASSVDNAIVRFDGTTGKLIQNYTSGAPTVADTGQITGNVTGALTGNADTATTASAGDAALDFFGAGVTAVTDATACTDIEGTALSITAGVLNVTETDPNALLTAGTDNVKDTHIDWGVGAAQVSAVDVPIADAGVIITATEVEGALQENRTAVNLNTSKVTESTTATSPLVKTTYDISIPAATNAAAGHATAAHITAIEANTAKVTNATHTGEVTGSTALTIADGVAVTNWNLTTPTLGVAIGTSLDLGTTSLLASRALTVDTGGAFNVALGSAAGDDFIIDTTGFVYEGDNNRVGIGMATPAVLLDLNDTTAASVNGQDVLRLRGIVSSAAVGSGAVISFTNPTGVELGNIRSYLEDGSSAGLHFGTFDSSTQQESRMVIASTGNVGIGTTGPTAKLDIDIGSTAVDGTIGLRVSRGAGVQDLLTATYSSGDVVLSGALSNDFIFKTLGNSVDEGFKFVDSSDNVRMVILKDGNVGIGTAVPSSLLDLEKAGTAKANLDIFEITNSGNAVDMDGTQTSILFNQWYYDATTPAVADAGRITVGAETDWTSVATTQDSYMSFKTALDGVITEQAKVDSSVTAGQTRFLIYDVDNATLERVTVGAADSGGVGYKVLRIPN